MLFSALIRDSATRRIIFEYDGLFLFPSFIFEELEEHKLELFRKSGLSKKDFDRLLGLILTNMHIVKKESFFPYIKQAWGLVKDIDPDDVIFVACALAYPGSILWSDDKRLKEIKDIRVMNTKDIMGLIL